MSAFKLIVIVICFHIYSALAAVDTCNVNGKTDDWSTIHTNYELKPSDVNITLGSQLSDWTLIYQISDIVVGHSDINCSAGNTQLYYTMFYSFEQIGQIGQDVIYRTEVPGIGVSVADSHYANYNALKPFPYAVHYGHADPGTVFRITVKFWKIPGENIPMGSGAISVTGPEVAEVFMDSGYTFQSDEPDRIFDGGSAFLVNSRILHATMMFQPGTCNIEGDNIIVKLGDYDGANGHSDWKDASFKLDCPTAYGYNGSVEANDDNSSPYNLPKNHTTKANTSKNGRVQISIVPYTETLDANRGIIGLDGTGAQGYGIQLAWGDYSTQNLAEPSKPVIVNSYVDAHSLNAAFSADDTPIGGNGLVGLDNTIKMAARYIRTTGKTQPGPANAVVQVIASYQ